MSIQPMLKKVILLVSFLGIMIALTSCGGQGSKIVGTWQRVTPVDTFSFLALSDQIEFLKDGTFILPNFNNASGTYSFPESDRIKFEGPYGAATYRFSVSDDKLIFEENGQMIEYQRLK